MNATRLLLAAFSLALPAAGSATSGFEPYQVILSRQPFGQAPEPLEAPVASPPAANPAAARDFRVCSLFQGPTSNDVRVGVINRTNQHAYLLRPGEQDDDLALVSADFEKQQVVLRQGGNLFTLTMDASSPSGPAPRRRPAPPPTPPGGPRGATAGAPPTADPVATEEAIRLARERLEQARRLMNQPSSGSGHERLQALMELSGASAATEYSHLSPAELSEHISRTLLEQAD